MDNIFNLINCIRGFLIKLPKDFNIASQPLDNVLTDLNKIEEFVKDLLEKDAVGKETKDA